MNAILWPQGEEGPCCCDFVFDGDEYLALGCVTKAGVNIKGSNADISLSLRLFGGLGQDTGISLSVIETILPSGDCCNFFKIVSVSSYPAYVISNPE